jgi:hypothetical protein
MRCAAGYLLLSASVVSSHISTSPSSSVVYVCIILTQVLAPELAEAWDDPAYAATLFAISGEHRALGCGMRLAG